MITAAAMLLPCMPYLTAAASGSNLKISTVEGLTAFRDAVNSGTDYANCTVSLEANITLSGSWTPIGTSEYPFKGTFNGNLNITSGDNAGLFGYVYSGYQETAAVKNVTVTGSINATGNAGGIVAYLDGGNSTVSCCHSDVAITGTGNESSAVGGIVGMNSSGTVINCYNTGNIMAKYNVGGIVGDSFSGTIAYCHDWGSVTHTESTKAYGAIIGSTNNDSITSCRYLSGVCEYGIGGTESGVVSTVQVKSLVVGEFSNAGDVSTNFPGWDFPYPWTMGTQYPVLTYNPYEGFTNHIKTVEQLEMLRDAVNAGNEIVNKYDTYYLDNDLDLSGIGNWEPIGTFYDRFNKIFTGWDEANNEEAVRKITGLTTNKGSDRQGLFAFNEGTIKNLIFDSCNVSGESYVGCVAAENSGTIQNITVTGSRVTGTVRDTGGVVGSNSLNGNINNVIVTGATTVSGVNNVGGIAGSQTGEITEAAVLDGTNITGTGNQVGGVAGYSFGDKIEDIEINGITVTGCEDTGGIVGRGNPAEGTVSIQNTAVSGTTEVGGIGGYNYSNIDGSSYTIADLTVSGTEKVGGIFGYSEQLVSNFTSSGTVTGTGDNIGGIVGYFSGYNKAISNCVNSASVSGTGDGSDSIGGIVGYNYSGTVTGCHTTSTSSVKGHVNIGGIAGKNGGAVKLSYNKGAVGESGQGMINVGGVVGSNAGSSSILQNSYNTGNVSATSVVGGVIGINDGSVTNCYSNGTVTKTGDTIGGVAGNNHGGNITSSYFLANKGASDVCGTTEGVGMTDTNSRALSAEELTDESNFIDWDFNDTSIWTLDNSLGAPVFFDLKLTRDEEDVETGYYTDANKKRHDDATAFVVTLTCGDVVTRPYVSGSITVGEQSKTYEKQLATEISGGSVKIGIILTGIADKNAVLKAQAMVE